VHEGGSTESQEASALADFDTGEVLDALSSGIIVLDEQLCAVYTNPRAESLLMMRLDEVRGRPLPGLLREGEALVVALREALDGKGAVCDCNLALASQREAPDRRVRVRTSLLPSQTARSYLLLQLECDVADERGS